MRQLATRDLFAYWNRLRGERSAPERSDIDPSAIRSVLADTYMLEVDIAHGFPFRLAGTRVNALFDADQKGLQFIDLWRQEERRNIAAVLMTVADGICPVVAGAVAAPRGQSECAFELLFLPLRHFGRTHSRILGLIKPTSEAVWLGLLPLGHLALRSLRIVDDPSDTEREPERIAVGQDLTVGQQRPAAGSLRIAEGSVRPGRPYLRVIQGGVS